MINDGENCWPSREQGLLLRAGLLKDRQALEAWQEWKSIIDIDDHLDDGSYRLLPLLYQNLKNHGVEDPFMNRLKGIYRLTWYKNQMLFHRNARLLNALRDSGIESLVLKGGALIPLYYKDYGIRPMADFDVLVHTDKALQAIDLLEKSGWIPKDFEPSEKYISQRYSHGFIDDEGKEFDLHWHVLSECCSPDSDDDFWEGAISTEINGVSAYALNPADQLLHVCVHGMKWDAVPTIRWISDAMIILNNTQADIDWDRLIAQAKKRWLTLPIKDTLNYLKEVLDAPVPSEVLEKLNKSHISMMERIEFRTKDRPPTIFTDFLQLWIQHSRLSFDSGTWSRIITFPGFLMNIWDLESLWKLPFLLFAKVIQGIRR